jgi:DNA-directed RNA polymerase subunit RPC12/RpoP
MISQYPCPKCKAPVNVVTLGLSDHTACDACGTKVFWARGATRLELVPGEES